VPWLILSSPIFAVNIPQQETGEKKQTHTYVKHFMETASDCPSVDFWGFELTKRNYVKETTSDFLKEAFYSPCFLKLPPRQRKLQRKRPCHLLKDDGKGKFLPTFYSCPHTHTHTHVVFTLVTSFHFLVISV
jgi:hypothetical protein